jgi:hypothetical protein
LIVEFV